ncbi:ribosome recycling factor [Labilibaculum filiforme]|uniref:Ribosome-recycling factor n=1 Tax=Labilibaculum filiforme TaxID=1940526 RepID=A0A2N3HWM4_9BACT|nr:ribosome recycling factor [Labilibaculum filiforme]PKQ62441.1 ribosome recycling factor [Labilibaculum filiforme]
MTEEVQMYLDDTQEKMEAAVDHLEKELVKIRAGRANPSMLNGVMVDYYGNMTPLAQVANLSVPDPRTIAIQPWEKPMIVQIEKAIMNSNLGFNPDNNGELIRIHIPPLTEERRGDLVKQAKAECEHAKVSIRNARRDTNLELKKLIKDGLSEDVEKDAEATVQKLTDKYSKSVDDLFADKEKDIMTI